jgi:hypothetical protein
MKNIIISLKSGMNVVANLITIVLFIIALITFVIDKIRGVPVLSTLNYELHIPVWWILVSILICIFFYYLIRTIRKKRGMPNQSVTVTNIKSVKQEQSLQFKEWTQESEILKYGSRTYKVMYTILKKRPGVTYPNNSSKGFSTLDIINDLRKIEFYGETEPDRYINYVKQKYHKGYDISYVFVECLKLILNEKTTFMQLFRHQPIWIVSEKIHQIFVQLEQEARREFPE